MKNRLIEGIVLSFLVGVAIISTPAVAATARCGFGDPCPIPVSGFATYEQREFAEYEAIDNCRAQCSNQYCQDYGELPGSMCGGSLCKVSSDTGCMFNGDIYDTSTKMWTASAYGTCECADCGGDDDNWPARVGQKIYTSPVFTPIKNFFSRLFKQKKS